MSTENNSPNPLTPFSRGPAHIGQIRFDPSEGLKDQLSELFLPEKREIGRRATKMYLSSQYVQVAYKTPGGRYVGNDGIKADRMRRAVELGGELRQHRLGQYMRTAERTQGGHEFLGLQFAVHLHPRIVQEVRQDDLLSQEALLKDNDPTIKAIFIYDGTSIFRGEEREAVLGKISKFVIGRTLLDPDEDSSQKLSPTSQAFLTNARFTFSTPHEHA